MFFLLTFFHFSNVHCHHLCFELWPYPPNPSAFFLSNSPPIHSPHHSQRDLLKTRIYSFHSLYQESFSRPPIALRITSLTLKLALKSFELSTPRASKGPDARVQMEVTGSPPSSFFFALVPPLRDWTCMCVDTHATHPSSVHTLNHKPLPLGHSSGPECTHQSSICPWRVALEEKPEHVHFSPQSWQSFKTFIIFPISQTCIPFPSSFSEMLFHVIFSYFHGGVHFVSKNSLAHMGSQYFDVWVTNVSPQFVISLLILLVEILVVWLVLCYGSLEGISLCRHGV